VCVCEGGGLAGVFWRCVPRVLLVVVPLQYGMTKQIELVSFPSLTATEFL
jgi:hypothetical protein